MQNTIGQRIADRRKLLGLSQEALGDKMGVSRQAISKWESDATVPEIDKLIALSKLFDVSIGWLLGTEPDAAIHDENTFSEQQLRLIEDIIRRYAAPTPAPAAAPRRSGWRFVGYICAALGYPENDLQKLLYMESVLANVWCIEDGELPCWNAALAFLHSE